MLLTSPPDRHTPLEDAQGIVVGTLLMALSVSFLKGADLFTGQIAGLSLVTSYALGGTFAKWFFILNLPFYILAFKRMGMRFTIKTFCAVGILSLWTVLLPNYLSFETLHPAAAAVMAGITSGAGLLALFRHGASLGGVGVVALYLQDRFNFRAGLTQMIFDAGVFSLAVFLFDGERVIYSLLGAVVLSIIIATNHRRDRYIAAS